MKQNKIQNILEVHPVEDIKPHYYSNVILDSVLVRDMNETQLENYHIACEVHSTCCLIQDAVRQLPYSRETAQFLTCLARDIRAYVEHLNSKCDETAEVDA